MPGVAVAKTIRLVNPLPYPVEIPALGVEAAPVGQPTEPIAVNDTTQPAIDSLIEQGWTVHNARKPSTPEPQAAAEKTNGEG